jgi:hypothetical protein
MEIERGKGKLIKISYLRKATLGRGQEVSHLIVRGRAFQVEERAVHRP